MRIVEWMDLCIRAATPRDLGVVSDMLTEAARWLAEAGMPLWKGDELSTARLTDEVGAGLYVLALDREDAAGVMRFQLEDPEFWPDVPAQSGAYIHRLAVRRQFAGGGVSTALLRWAVERTGSLGRRYLRLDCDAARPRLRAVYERFGFCHHSDRQVGPYFVARYEYDVATALP